MSSLTPESQWIMEHHDTLDNSRVFGRRWRRFWKFPAHSDLKCHDTYIEVYPRWKSTYLYLFKPSLLRGFSLTSTSIVTQKNANTHWFKALTNCHSWMIHQPCWGWVIPPILGAFILPGIRAAMQHDTLSCRQNKPNPLNYSIYVSKRGFLALSVRFL